MNMKESGGAPQNQAGRREHPEGGQGEGASQSVERKGGGGVVLQKIGGGRGHAGEGETRLREFREFDASQSQPWELPKKATSVPPRRNILLVCAFFFSFSFSFSFSDRSSLTHIHDPFGSPLLAPPLATRRLCRVPPWPRVPPRHASPSPSPRRTVASWSPSSHRPFAARAPRHASPVHRARPSSRIAPSPCAPLVMRRPFAARALATRRPFAARAPRHASPLRRARPSSRAAHRVSPRHARRSARTWSGGGDSASEGRVECSTGKNSSVVD
jgi:hypothetical protein